MSSEPNHRRGEERRQDNGPTWEGPTPNTGGTHVARARNTEHYDQVDTGEPR